MSSADRWPLTSAWHTGEWTSEVCEHLRDQVSDLIRDNRLRAQRAISSRDWAADDECAERSRYLRACEDELDDRAAARRRWERAQWTGTSHHWLLRWGLLGSVLRAAREGTLTPDWRGGLDAAVAERNRQAAFEADADVAALVVHELSTMSPQPWEPYVAGGDWRAALAAWYRDSLQLHQWQWEQQAAEREWRPRWLRGSDERHVERERVKHARSRDALEASYRAGLAAGGETEDWIGWYRRRITETWDRRTAVALHDPELTLAWLDGRGEWLEGRGAADMQRLPAYWTSKQQSTSS